jgi:hypothetical protein
MRGWADRTIAVAVAAKLSQPAEDGRISAFKYEQRWRANEIMRLLQPPGQRLGTDMDGYNRRLALVLAAEQLGRGANRRDLSKLFEENYKYVALAPV